MRDWSPIELYLGGCGVRRRLLMVLLLLPVSTYAEPLSDLARRGRSVMIDHECNRCHDVSDVSGRGLGIAPAEEEIHCVRCHTTILGTRGNEALIQEKSASFPLWRQYLENIVHLTALPDLGSLTRRVDPVFIRQFLASPFDLRPNLPESMIPVPLTEKEKDSIVRYLFELNGQSSVKYGAASWADISPSAVEKGRKVFVSRGCPTCHLVGNEKLVNGFDRAFYRYASPVAKLAPNLRYVRQRIPRHRLVDFVVNPKAVDPKTAMPQQIVSRPEAEAIADFLGGAELVLPPLPTEPEVGVPVMERPVTFAEVKQRVFQKVCVHCHMNAEANEGLGGPGNTGGLGFEGVGLDMETIEGIRAGLLRNGRRISILRPSGKHRQALLVEVLIQRRREALRDQRLPYGEYAQRGQTRRGQKPGMPLGLPALSLADISLVKSWIEQGAPGD